MTCIAVILLVAKSDCLFSSLTVIHFLVLLCLLVVRIWCYSRQFPHSFIRLAFTDNVIRVVIRSAERYDLVKIKLMKSEGEYQYHVRHHLLRSSDKLDCWSRKRKPKINQSKSLRTGIVIGLFLRFCLRLRQSSLHWIISVRVTSGIRRKWNHSDSSDSDSVEVMTPISIFTRSEARLRLRL